MKHVTVYAEAGIYAGWPANHGAWQWGDEFLVGFLRGKYRRRSMHNVIEPFELLQARSMDGGETWRVESTGIPIQMGQVLQPAPYGDSIIRVRGVYDHGGDYVAPCGGYYASQDRGASWAGPFAFCGIEGEFSGALQCTARTRVLGDLVFLSKADAACWGTDDVLCVKRLDNGKFDKLGELPSGDARCVMPAVARVGERIVAVCRRRKTGRRGGWIEAFASDDGGHKWRSLGEVGVTGKNNGNPPALIERGGELVCCYGNRTDCQIVARVSKDLGESWSVPLVLRQGTEPDIGYPQLFKRSDGGLVCVYYWASEPMECQNIQASIF